MRSNDKVVWRQSRWADLVHGVGEVADISTVARSLIDERADFAGTSKSPFAPAFVRRPLTVMIAVPTLETGAADEDADASHDD